MIGVFVLARLWRVLLLGGLVFAALPIGSALASTTIGQVGASAGTAGQCGTGVFGDQAYKVPAGGGTIRSFSVQSSAASANGQREFLVLRGSGSSWKIIGKSGLVTLFGTGLQSVPADIAVQSGDILGVVIAGGPYQFHQECIRVVASGGGFMSAATPADLSVGATISFAYTPANCTNCTKEALNVSADLGLASQTISFGALSNTTYGSGSFTLTATGGSSGNPVTYALGSGSVGCSLSGTNNATVSITGVTGVGQRCIIVASQAGSATYEAATSVTRDFTIAKASQAISFGALSNTTYGAASSTLTATGGGSGNPVTYLLGAGSVGCSLSGTNNATVSITGVTGVGETCIIVASQAGNANHEAATSVTRDFTIARAELTVTADSMTMTYADPVPQLTYQIAGFVNGETPATSGVTGTPGLSTTATSSSEAATYAIMVATGQLASANYSFQLVNGTLAIVKRQASVQYTGANYARIAAAGNATINVSAKVSRSGSLGDIALARVEFVVKRFDGAVQTTVYAMANANGIAATTASVPNSDDPYTIDVRIDPANAYWTSGVDVAPLQVTVGSGTGRTSGDGWIPDASNTVNGRSNFGFTVQNATSGITGSSVFTFRALEGGNQVQYVVKSDSWQGGGLTFRVNTDRTRATFTGNATVQRYVNGVLATSFNGGNHRFTVDVFDGDLLRPKQRDGYAITVRNSANAIIKQLGTRTNPVPLGDGKVLIQGA